MSSSVIVGLALAVVLGLVWWLMRKRASEDSRAAAADRLDTLTAWPPTATRVMTSHERLAYSTLLRAFPDHLILAQVPLSRFLRVPTRHSHAEWLRRVGQLCVDLVVCDTASQPLAVIIVEAPGGAPTERARLRHERMVRVLRAADIRCFLWVENALPSVESARASVLEHLPEAVRAGVTAPAPVAAVVAAAAPRSAPAVEAVTVDATQRDSGDEASPDGREPPPTWYDDIHTSPAPLLPTNPPEQGRR